MTSERGLEMASRTISDVTELSEGPEQDADSLMRDVSTARDAFGRNSQDLSTYDNTVANALERKGILPMLSLGHLKNNFQEMDLDGTGDISRDELLIARENAGSAVEARMLAMLAKGFGDIRSAHESNQFNPFAEDEKGITIADIDAKLEEGRSHRNAGGHYADLDPGISAVEAPGWPAFEKLNSNSNRHTLR